MLCIYAESKKSWNENIVLSYNDVILGTDYSNMQSTLINSRDALVLRGCDVLQWRIWGDGGTPSSKCCKVQYGSLWCGRLTSTAEATGVVACPWTMVSSWLSVWFSCCAISLANSLSHKPCGLFELCRSLLQGWRTAPVCAGLGILFTLAIPNSSGSSVAL